MSEEVRECVTVPVNLYCAVLSKGRYWSCYNKGYDTSIFLGPSILHYAQTNDICEQGLMGSFLPSNSAVWLVYL